MGWWVADLLKDNPALLVSWVVWVIGSIVLHELAHGWAAIWQGDRTPIETGHMTWNPLVHMGGMSLLMFAVVGIAWGAMPVNPGRFRGRHGDAYVSLAGPAMNLGLALVSCVLAAVWIDYAGGVSDPLRQNIQTFFVAGAFLNFVLCVFNLLPVPPLDGSRILASVSGGYRSLMSGPNAGTISLVAFVLVFMFAGKFIFPVARTAAWGVIDAIRAVLPGAGVP